MCFCHLLVFVDKEKKALSDTASCILSAHLSKIGREGGGGGVGVVEKKGPSFCFVMIFNWFILRFSPRVGEEITPL